MWEGGGWASGRQHRQSRWVVYPALCKLPDLPDCSAMRYTQRTLTVTGAVISTLAASLLLPLMYLNRRLGEGGERQGVD